LTTVFSKINPIRMASEPSTSPVLAAFPVGTNGIGAAAARENEDQYHHFIPRFILKTFAPKDMSVTPPSMNLLMYLDRIHWREDAAKS